MQEKENKKYDDVVKIPQRKKIGISITKFEKYPEMAAEGVWRAIGYLAFLMIIFAIVVAIAETIMFGQQVREGIDYLEENISSINYENGNLTIGEQGETTNLEAEDIRLIVDTNDISQEKITEYEDSIASDETGIIWLNNKVIIDYGIHKIEYVYSDIFKEFGIEQFNKTDVINYLEQNVNSPVVYITYAGILILALFAAYFIVTLIDVFVLSIFGVITSWFARIKIRYRAVFNMSVYAMTLSLILKLIYIVVNMFTGFEIKYFDLMYSAISFVCLAAAIFMIKSDVVKQQMELIKNVQEQGKKEKQKNDEEEQEERKREEQRREEQRKEEQEKEDEEKNKGENKNEKKKEDKTDKENNTDKEEGVDKNAQGSNA